MKVKKTWFGYLNFIIGNIVFGALSIALCVCIHGIDDFSVSFLDFGSDFNVFLPWIVSVIGVGAVIGFLFLFRKLRVTFINKYYAGTAVFYFLFAVIIALGFYLRNSYAYDFTGEADSMYSLLTDTFYKNEVSYPDILTKVYAYIIAFIFKFTGIKESVYIYFNIFVFEISALIITLALSKVFNKTASLGALLLITVFPSIVESVVAIKPKLILLIPECLVLLIVSCIVKNTKYSNNSNYSCVGRHLSFYLLAVAVIILNDLFDEFAFLKSFDINRIEATVPEYIYVLFAVSILCFFATASYIKASEDNISTLVLSFVTFGILYLTFDNNSTVLHLVLITLGLLSGIGIHSFLFDIVVKGNNLDYKDSVIDLDKDASTLDEGFEYKYEKPEENESQSVPYIEPEEVKKPSYIENILPEPKKHVKKEIQFEYRVPERDMHFDLDIDENDNFDK